MHPRKLYKVLIIKDNILIEHYIIQGIMHLMLAQKIIQQISGIFILSLPAIIIYQWWPAYILHPLGITAYALTAAFWITYQNYAQIKNLQNILKYTPTGNVLAHLNDEITKCEMNPKDVILRYCYLNDNIANASLNLIRIDQMLWKGIDNDPDAQEARNIVARNIIPAVPKEHKELQEKIHALLTPEAQSFIFRHELGHVQSKTSQNIFVGIFIVSLLAALATLFTAKALLTLCSGTITLILGIIFGALLDEIAGYILNATIKVREEWRADYFASKYSSAEEISAAADFFEGYEAAAKEFRAKTLGIMNYLPITALTAHPANEVRVAYLRKIANQKS